MSRYGQKRSLRAPCHRASQCGLTLIELLVSLAILMILTSFIVGGLSTTIGAFNTDRRSTTEMASYAAEESVRGLIASAIPAANVQPGGPLLFDGQREELRFVTLSEGRTLRGGPQDVRIRRHGKELVVEVFGSLRDNVVRKAPISSTTIVRGLRDVRFRYFGGAGEPAWRDDWTKSDRLPALVEMSFNFEDTGRNAPVSIVALRNEGAPGGS